MKFLHQKFSNNNIQIPGSKSHFQRIALIIFAFDIKSIKIKNVGFSNDDKSAIKLLADNGFKITEENDSILIKKISSTNNRVINIGESGFLTRSLLAILACKGLNCKIIGEGTILKRDFSSEIYFLKKNGVHVVSDQNKLPIQISGKLKTDKLSLNASNSSQFLSGLLIGLAAEEFKKKIKVNSLKSNTYIDLTLKTLKEFGIDVINENYIEFHFSSNKLDISSQIHVESDWSSASFWIIAGLISQDLKIDGLDIRSTQADRSILNLLENYNISYEFQNSLLIKKQPIPGFIFDANNCPDLIPILTLLAFHAKSSSEIIGVDRLTNKESNRKEVLKTEFKKLGAKIKEASNKFIIEPSKLNSGSINSYNDHRIAMTFIIASITNRLEIEIKNVECINKSYPQFINHFKSLGGIVNE